MVGFLVRMWLLAGGERRRESSGRVIAAMHF